MIAKNKKRIEFTKVKELNSNRQIDRRQLINMEELVRIKNK